MELQGTLKWLCRGSEAGFALSSCFSSPRLAEFSQWPCPKAAFLPGRDLHGCCLKSLKELSQKRFAEGLELKRLPLCASHRIIAFLSKKKINLLLFSIIQLLGGRRGRPA